MAILRWIFALAVGGFLIAFGAMKFAGAHIFQYIEFKATGLGLPMADLFYPVVNYATGGLELAAGILTILPMTRSFGSKLAVLPFAGAVGFHLSPLLGVVTPDGFTPSASLDQALASGGPFLAEHFAGGSYFLFTLAAVMLGVAVINALFIQK